MNFSKRLKIIRISKGIEPIEMAVRLCVSESTYRRYERGESEPTISVLRKISSVFEMKISEILEDETSIALPSLSKQDGA